VAEGQAKTPDLLAIGISTWWTVADEPVGGRGASELHVDGDEGARTLPQSRSADQYRSPRARPISLPDYEGIHATKLDKKNDRVLVVAAVPGTLKFDEVSRYFAGVLREARKKAIDYAAKRKVPASADRVSGLIDHLLNQIEATAR
jgi:hypothetical protein